MYCDVLKQDWTDYIHSAQGQRGCPFWGWFGTFITIFSRLLWAISETISPFLGMLWAKLLVWVKWQSLFFVLVQPCAQGHDSKTITEQKEKGWIICRPVIIIHSLQYSISEPFLCGSTQHQDLLENGMRPDLPPTATSYYYACHVSSMHAMHHNTFNVSRQHWRHHLRDDIFREILQLVRQR